MFVYFVPYGDLQVGGLSGYLLIANDASQLACHSST